MRSNAADIIHDIARHDGDYDLLSDMIRADCCDALEQLDDSADCLTIPADEELDELWIDVDDDPLSLD